MLDKRIWKAKQLDYWLYNKSSNEVASVVIALMEVFFFVWMLTIPNAFTKYRFNMILYVVTFSVEVLVFCLSRYAPLKPKAVTVLYLFNLTYLTGFSMFIALTDFMSGGQTIVLLSLILSLVGFFLFNPLIILVYLIVVCGLFLWVARQYAGFGFNWNFITFFILAFTVSLMKSRFHQRNEDDKHKLEFFSSHDALTGALNRNALVETCASLRGKKAFFLLLDIDDFKVVNDTKGHNVGDAYLKELTNILQFAFSPESVFRYGGDEFLVISEHPDPNWKQLLHCDIQFSGSYGATIVPEEMMGLVASLDAALYAVKQHGKGHLLKVELGEKGRHGW